jgi:MoxR-like ATPase
VEVSAAVDLDTMLTLQELGRNVFVNPLVLDYIMRLVDATRQASEVRLGVSVRGTMSLAKIALTWAASRGRTFVTPDDVRALAIAALSHRIILEPEAEFDGVTAVDVIGQILLDVPAPTENGAG